MKSVTSAAVGSGTAHSWKFNLGRIVQRLRAVELPMMASSKTIPLRLWLPTLEMLRGEADARNVSVQDIVRIAIGEYIAKLKALDYE